MTPRERAECVCLRFLKEETGWIDAIERAILDTIEECAKVAVECVNAEAEKAEYLVESESFVTARFIAAEIRKMGDRKGT